MATASLLYTDFSGSSDPDLTPIPFSNVVESAGNDFLYEAVNGFNNTPCARSDYGGTGNDAYGVKVFGTTYSPAGVISTISSLFKRNQDPFSLSTNATLGLLRFRSPTQNICTLGVAKTALPDMKFQIRYNIGSVNASGSTLLADDTFYAIKMVLDGTAGAETVTLFVDGVQEAQIVIGGAIPDTVRDGRCGGLGSGNTPSAGTILRHDNLSITRTGAGIRLPAATGCLGSALRVPAPCMFC